MTVLESALNSEQSYVETFKFLFFSIYFFIFLVILEINFFAYLIRKNIMKISLHNSVWNLM